MKAWDNFLKVQEEELGKEITDKWLRTLKVVDFDACNLYLEAKDSFQALWFEEHIRIKIKSKLFNNNHHPIKVHLIAAEETTVSSKKVKSKKEISPQQPPLFLSDQLDPHATFETYVAGSGNELSLKILNEISKEQISPFNPIYLYGPSGVGKTHLLMALANRLIKAGLNVIFIRAETFTDHVVSAIQKGMMREFRKSYRNADVLLIDDVHLFARRNATQEEFFHTFNTLHTARRQIVLAGNTAPQQLEDIEQRLISRFEWGISLHLQKLTPVELKEVLQKRLNVLQFELANEIQEFLIATFKSTTQSLIRSLEALVLRSKSNSLSVEEAAHLLKDLIEEENHQALSPDKIVHFVANFYGVTDEDILGRSHSHECALPRQIAMYLCRRDLNLPFQKIGRIFTRDHSTVMTSVKAIQQKIDAQDPDISEILMKFRQ